MSFDYEDSTMQLEGHDYHKANTDDVFYVSNSFFHLQFYKIQMNFNYKIYLHSPHKHNSSENNHRGTDP